jgi:hypothetical protein
MNRENIAGFMLGISVGVGIAYPLKPQSNPLPARN